ncbi:MAG: hypothetical protein M1812_004144 [Candelaria pacifica]|nr:MAG: hypothetical protein M1812_004144 [Candelaria pacifica]
MTAQSHRIRGHSNPPDNSLGQTGAYGDHAAALRGASLAFRAPPVQAKPLVNTYTGTFGALAAAKKADYEDKLHNTGSSITGSSTQTDTYPTDNRGSAGAGDAPLSAAAQSVLRERLRVSAGSKKHTSSLEIPLDGHRSVSPSNIAATLAAARSTSHTPHTQTSNTSGSNTMSDEERKDVRPPLGAVRNTKQLFAQPNGSQRSGKLRIQYRGQLTSGATTQQFHGGSSIGPANTLIGLYEQKNSAARGDVDKFSVLKSSTTAPVIRSPKPYRPPSSSNPPLPAALNAIHARSSSHGAVDVSTEKTQRVKPGNDVALPAVSVRYTSNDRSHDHATNVDPRSANHEIRSTVGGAGAIKGKDPPKPPVPRKTLRSESASRLSKTALPAAQYDSDDSSVASYASALASRSKPALPPPRRKGSEMPTTKSPSSNRPPVRHAATEEAVSISQNGLRKPKPIDIPQRGLATPPKPLPPSRARSWVDDLPLPSSGDGTRYRPGRGKESFPHMTEDSLANAIVASSLASSRASSPAVSPQPPLPARHNKHHHYFHHDSHTPSPPKAGMRHTMRGPPRSDDEDESSHKRGRKNLIKKHPHKHHEADRKRWRDQITERERKRYEGVWAANKGLHVFLSSMELSQFPPSQQPLAGKDLVAGPVVRDIWSRSRLPIEILQEVWDLVDNAGVGKLDREEFVVGLWLIDQSLKGRKLPIKVSESVWGSVRRLGGIKVPKRRK